MLVKADIPDVLDKCYFVDLVSLWCYLDRDDQQDDLAIGLYAPIGQGAHVRSALIDLIRTHEDDEIIKAIEYLHIID